MRSVEEQLQAAIALASPLAPLELSLRESLGCVIATDIITTYPIPGFDSAAYDGYAVRADSIFGASTSQPVSLNIVDSVGAGYTSDFEVGPGQAVRVESGVLLPKGADTVVPVSGALSTLAEVAPAEAVAPVGEPTPEAVGESEADDVTEADEVPSQDAANPPEGALAPKLSRKERKLLKRQQASAATAAGEAARASTIDAIAGGEWVSITTATEVGVGVVAAGSQRAAGAHLLSAGTRLGDRELATVAAGGHARVAVYPRPRVVIITVGDGLVDTTRALVQGLAYDVVSVMLVAAGEQAGATAFRGGPARRDIHALARTVEDQLVRADLILIVGEDESTVNPHDGLVASALREAGCQDLEYAQLRPGPAMGLGTVGEDGIAVITIGSSVLAAFIGFEVFARPTIAALSGRQSLFRPVVRATLTEAVVGHGGVREFRPGSVRLDAQGTRALVSVLHEPDEQAALWLGNANALVILPEEAPIKHEGEEVAVIRLDRE